MNFNEIKVDTIYHLKKGLNGLKVCILKSNRNNPKKNKAMMQGCLETEMQQPGIFTDARPAYDAGYTLLDVMDGHVLTESEVDGYLVILDGNTRFHAWLQALQANTPFTYIFQYKKYRDADTFKRAYQTINVYNTPTSTADYIRDFAVTSNNPVLMGFNQKVRDGLFPKAAGYATIGREIMKSDIVKLSKGSGPAYFSETKLLNAFTILYDGLKDLRMQCPAIFKGTEVWRFTATKINSASDAITEAERMLKLLTTLPPTLFLRITKAKKEGAKPKETVVAEILEEGLKLLN